MSLLKIFQNINSYCSLDVTLAASAYIENVVFVGSLEDQGVKRRLYYVVQLCECVRCSRNSKVGAGCRDLLLALAF
jgi:hypothetical protein